MLALLLRELIMTYEQAKLIIYNPEAYPKGKVVAAIAFILAYLEATYDEIQQAMSIS